MIVFVDLEHDRLQQNPDAWTQSLARRLTIKYRLEDIAGDLCLIVRYPLVTPQLLADLDVRAVVVSGNMTDWEHYAAADLAGLRTVLRLGRWPTLAFCGGCQLLAEAFGAPLGPMVPPTPAESSARYEERGFLPLQIVEPHPLFEGLGPVPVVFQAHYWEVKELPVGFHLLASSERCRIQAIAHETLPLVGTQFHPEQYDDAHPDGRRIVENFFRHLEQVAG